MEHTWTDTVDVPDSVLVDRPRERRGRRRGPLAAGERTLVCVRCWSTFEGFSRASCPQCSARRPDGGWSSLPFTFRDRYVFTKPIGRGGMGAVFLAQDEHQLDEARRTVAVKVVPTNGAPALRDALKRMFEREAAAGAMLAQSPHFVKVTSHDVGVEPAYMVMEFVDWPTLRALLRRGQGEAQPLSPVKTARIGVALLRGLSTMHFHRIVHRDLKPDNVFVRRATDGEDYEVKILDLGVWTYDATDPSSPHSLSAVTRADEGSPVGTFAYMSPEQLRLAPVGPRSDLHTVGSLLWELITGSVPYPMPRTELPAAMRERDQALRAVPPKPSCMPQGLYAVLAKALTYEASARWSSADEMRGALKAWLADALRWTKSAVVEAKAHLSVMDQQLDTLLRRVAPARELIVELEELRAQLKAEQRRADEVPLEALAAAERKADRAFQALTEKLGAFAEAVSQGVLEGAAATGDLPSMEVGADGVPMVPAGPSVAVDLDDEPAEGAPPPAALSSAPLSSAAHARARARSRLRASAVVGLIGVGVAVGGAWIARAERARLEAREAERARAAAEPARAPVGRAAVGPDTVDLGPDRAASLDAMLGTSHTEGPASVAWSPDGLRLASGASDGVLRIHDGPTGAARARLPALDGGAIHAVAWASDGLTAAAASDDGTLRFWDVAQQRSTGVAQAHVGPARVLVAHAGTFVSGGDDGRVRVWSAENGQLVLDLTRPPPPAPPKKRGRAPAHEAVAPSAPVIAVAAGERETFAAFADGSVLRWSSDGVGKPIARLTDGVTSIAAPPSGAWLAVGGPTSLALFRLSPKAGEPAVLASGAVTAVAAQAGGARLASAHADGSVRVWQVDAGATSASLAGAPAEVRSLAFSADGRRLAAGGRDGSIVWWDASSGARLFAVDARRGALRSVAIDGTSMIALGSAVWRVELATGARLAGLDIAPQSAAMATIGAGGRRALVLAAPDDAQLIDLATGAPRRALPLAAAARALALAPTGAWAAAATDDDRVRVWSTDSGVERGELAAPGVRALASSPDGDRLAAAGEDGRLRVWSIAGRERALDVDLTLGALSAVVWSSDGASLAAGSADGRVVVVDGELREPRALPRTAGGPVRALAFSPRAALLAVGGRDTRVDLIPLSAGKPLVLEGHPLGVTDLAFSGDGAWLVAAGADGTARLHDLVRLRSRTVAERDGAWISVDDDGRATCDPAPCPRAAQ